MYSVKLLFVIVASTFIVGCNGGSSNDEDNGFRLSSESYSNGEDIPLRYVCEFEGGNDISPSYSWENDPEGTSSYALIMDDEDDPCGSGDGACVHWGVFNIPSSTHSLAEGVVISEIAGVVEDDSYRGPCPPVPHTYKTTVYALDSNMPELTAGTYLTRSEFQASYSSYILDSATMSGQYTPSN